MELRGADIFRPEVTEPIGVKDPLLAWGLSFVRLTMLMRRLKDIRDIYISDVDWLKSMPHVRGRSHESIGRQESFYVSE